MESYRVFVIVIVRFSFFYCKCDNFSNDAKIVIIILKIDNVLNWLNNFELGCTTQINKTCKI